MSIIVGIDASRNRSGGAKAYIIGILSSISPEHYGISVIHIWAFRSLLNMIPDKSWLVKHAPLALEGSLTRQLWWQAVHIAKEVRVANCDILFTTDASTLSKFKPMVVLSQDMLSYEPRMMKYYGYGLSRARLLVILYLQNRAFRRARGVIFLTRYVSNMIQRSCGILNNVVCIPHGVGAAFQAIEPKFSWPIDGKRPIQCLYVSNTLPYKNQWHVVAAVSQLRQQGFNLLLDLVGGGIGKAQKRLDAQIAKSDLNKEFVNKQDFVSQQLLPEFLSRADIFVFASSCENMPITLVEAMAAGLPIACSNRGPMPEVLEDGGIYFDPENPGSIAEAIAELINNPEKRTLLSKRAKELSKKYSWSRCANETFSFIAHMYANKNEGKSL